MARAVSITLAKANGHQGGFLTTSLFSIALALLAWGSFLAQPTLAKSYDLGIDAASEYKAAEIVANPAPVIPSELSEQSFKSCCIARFQIAKDGKFKVKLLSSSGNNDIDDLTLSTLKRWKFHPAMLDGQPVSSTRRIKVEFEID
jgi:TonB family protein